MSPHVAPPSSESKIQHGKSFTNTSPDSKKKDNGNSNDNTADEEAGSHSNFS